MQNRQAAMPFIFVTVLLDMLGIGLIIPVLPKLVTTLYGGDISSGATIFGYFTSAAAPVKLPGAAFIASSILVAIGAILAVRGLRLSLEKTPLAADALNP